MKGNTNSNAASPANVKADTAPGPVKLEMNDAAITAHADKLFNATQAEANFRLEMENGLTTKQEATWPLLRDETVATIAELGHVNAGLMLDVYLLRCKQAAGYMNRGIQYAANLRRLVKAAAAGKEVPADLLTVGRAAYLEHAFWTASGILAKTGTKKGTKGGKAPAAKPEPDKTDGEKEADTSVSEAIGADEEWKELTAIFASLRGVFRDEAIEEVTTTLLRIANKQHLATGTGQQ